MLANKARPNGMIAVGTGRALGDCELVYHRLEVGAHNLLECDREIYDLETKATKLNLALMLLASLS